MSLKILRISTAIRSLNSAGHCRYYVPANDIVQLCSYILLSPVADCKHVAVAKAYLDRSKFSESTKKKIAACINKKAKTLKCNVVTKASEGKEFSYSSLDKECKALYNSDVFAATKKMVDDSMKMPGNM